MAREMKVGEEFKFVVRRLEYCQRSIYGIGMDSRNKFIKLFQYKHYHAYSVALTEDGLQLMRQLSFHASYETFMQCVFLLLDR